MSEFNKSIDSRAAALRQDCVFVKYRASRGRHTRLIKVAKTAADPLQPPKFRYKRIPRAGRDSPPTVVMQSPPRPLTAEDLQNWKVPPCVSRWKNPKGYAVPLDKRHSAEGWESESEINHGRMAELAEALHVAEEAASDGVALRGKIRREWEMREKERREGKLRELAMGVRDGNWWKKRRGETKKKKSGGGGGGEWEGDRLGESAKGELLFDLSLVDAYAHKDGDEVKTMKMRERRIEFEKEEGDGDFFGLGEFLSKLNQ